MKERIKQRIDAIRDEDMNELEKLIENFERSKSQNGNNGETGNRNFLLELSEIAFDGPGDLAASFDLNRNGQIARAGGLR